MRNSGIQFLLTVVAACISLMFFIRPTHGSNIVIGGNTTDIGTIIFVSPKPGDTPATAGMALRNLVDGITDNSAYNPYLIKIGPGVYDLGATSLQMKEYVDIEGSGEKTTKITGAVTSASLPPTNGTVYGASNAELRFITVENTGGGGYSVALLNSSVPSPSILHVTASATGGTSCNYGVYNYYSTSPVMTNVTASGTGGTNSYGVYNNSSSPVMTNVTASGTGGTSGNYGVYNYYSPSPVMMNVTATASGGTSTYGVRNNISSPVMTNVTTSGTGGTSGNYGVYTYSSSPVMTNVTASATGGTNNRGVLNDSSSAVMTNVTASASGGTTSYGVLNNSSGTVKINHSVVKGTTNTISNGSGVTTRVGNTQLDGGPISNSGTLTCVGAYDGNYAPLNASCQ
jgi:hypothetical protein